MLRRMTFKSRANSTVVRWLWVVLAAVLLGSGAGHAQGVRAPKLVVVLVVDQMRGDYVERYGNQWTGGLHRLVTAGARFLRASYPYSHNVTCAGHATIATGTFPSTSGITGNSWFDRALGRSIRCSDEPGATTVSYAGSARSSNGPGRLLAPTLTDEMRAQLAGPTRVVTMSMKDRTAIMLAGRRSEATTWFSATARGMVTSSYYTRTPVPFVAEFVRANPIEAEFNTPWTRARPADRYLFDDDGVGEKPPPYWTRTFPHAFAGSADPADAWEAWESSPRSDAYLGRFGTAAIDALKLGQGAGTDFLGISFSALDLVGHDFGPASHEVQDVLIRLDKVIGALLAHLDRTVGAANYVLALTGDHGVALIPEAATKNGLDAGRVRTSVVAKAAQEGLQRALGTGEYKIRQVYSDVYLDAAVVETLRANPAAVETVLRTLRAAPGVAAAFFSEFLDSHAAAGSRDARAALLNYAPGRSGDFVVLPRPNWFFVTEDGTPQPGSASSHGVPYSYDQHVPLVLFGAGITKGQSLRAVTPADIAPTLAFLCGITLPRPDGEVLVEALAPPPAAPPRR
jgi:predicted AlkP superfamily pyrophosphatase or phosphodiesterase